MTGGATQAQLLRCVQDLERGNIAHTLAYCLFWSQYATHEKDGRPSIYKTGPEIAAVMPVTARTANAHLKALSAKGYWDLDYRPKPGSVGKVSWLNFSERSQELVRLSKTIELSARRRRPHKPTSTGQEPCPSGGGLADALMSENTTSTQTITSTKTAKEKGFILTKSQGKTGMNEASSLTKTQGEGEDLKAPKWMEVAVRTEQMANVVQGIWRNNNLPDWDWCSKFTWRHLDEIRLKLGKRGYVELLDVERVFAELVKHWSWLRFGMEVERHQHHQTNLHRPSPLALTFECYRLVDKLEARWVDEAKFAGKATAGESVSNLEEDFS